jgi:2-deoxy-D-gluconate 3-dehydrogenase
VQLTRSLASAWAPDNIQANAVLPGWIDTDLTRGAREQVPGLHENVLRRTPAARWGVINDLSGIAVFLASPASDFITGAAIPVDGGYSIQQHDRNALDKLIPHRWKQSARDAFTWSLKRSESRSILESAAEL